MCAGALRNLPASIVLYAARRMVWYRGVPTTGNKAPRRTCCMVSELDNGDACCGDNLHIAFQAHAVAMQQPPHPLRQAGHQVQELTVPIQCGNTALRTTGPHRNYTNTLHATHRRICLITIASAPCLAVP